MAREYPCCLCPANYSNFTQDFCPNCDFVKKYLDERGWIYFVRSGIGQATFKAFYKKPNSNRERGCSMVNWQSNFMQAQIELNQLAAKKRWREK